MRFRWGADKDIVDKQSQPALGALRTKPRSMDLLQPERRVGGIATNPDKAIKRHVEKPVSREWPV